MTSKIGVVQPIFLQRGAPHTDMTMLEAKKYETSLLAIGSAGPFRGHQAARDVDQYCYPVIPVFPVLVVWLSSLVQSGTATWGLRPEFSVSQARV